MKLQEAFDKSDTVCRESKPDEIYKREGEKYTLNGEDHLFGFEELGADDWLFEIRKWLGHRGPKAKGEK